MVSEEYKQLLVKIIDDAGGPKAISDLSKRIKAKEASRAEVTKWDVWSKQVRKILYRD